VIVVDASVAAKWYLAEPDSPQAIALLNTRSTFGAPDIIRLEVTSAITRAVRTGRISNSQARHAAQSWLGHLRQELLVLEPAEADIESAIDLALGIGHGLMDCLYLAMAIRHAASFITTDALLVRRSRSIYADVRTL
jgi:predicted nucleic acid-binding protein